MRKLRWAMDGGGFWELDVETPVNVDGTAHPVPGLPLPLGLSRGSRLSRPVQIDFMHRFMATPFAPSHHPDRGLALDRVLAFHPHPNLTGFFVHRLLLRKATAIFREASGLRGLSWVWNVARKLCETSPYAVGAEVLVTSDTSLAAQMYTDDEKILRRYKADLTHKFPHHDLNVQAAYPGLFVDNHGTYWDVPSLVTLDVASHASDSGLSYHLCLQNISGEATALSNKKVDKIPATLLPGLSAKAAFSFKKNIDFWRKKDGKLKLVQPYDLFLSDPHFSASTVIGSVVGAWIGDGSSEACLKTGLEKIKPGSLHGLGSNAYVSADLFGSVAFTAQHGNFQRFLFDLTRLSTRLEFPSGSALVRGAAGVLHDLCSFRPPRKEAFGTACPIITLSLQQQLAGPVSFRVESRIGIDAENKSMRVMQVDDTIFALEYAMQVLGSARATAWYSQKNQEAMVELRFFES